MPACLRSARIFIALLAQLLSSVLTFEMAVLAWSGFLQNGVLPSVGSFAAMPYSTRTYHLCATLSQSLSPLGALAALRLRMSSYQQWLLATAWTISAVFIVCLALSSPSPPLRNSDAGDVLVVLANIVTAVGITYSKTLALSSIKATTTRRAPLAVDRAMFWAGATVQIASLAGSLLLFVLVNHSHLFVQQ